MKRKIKISEKYHFINVLDENIFQGCKVARLQGCKAAKQGTVSSRGHADEAGKVCEKANGICQMPTYK